MFEQGQILTILHLSDMIKRQVIQNANLKKKLAKEETLARKLTADVCILEEQSKKRLREIQEWEKYGIQFGKKYIMDIQSELEHIESFQVMPVLKHLKNQLQDILQKLNKEEKKE